MVTNAPAEKVKVNIYVLLVPIVCLSHVVVLDL